MKNLACDSRRISHFLRWDLGPPHRAPYKSKRPLVDHGRTTTVSLIDFDLKHLAIQNYHVDRGDNIAHTGLQFLMIPVLDRGWCTNPDQLINRDAAQPRW